MTALALGSSDSIEPPPARSLTCCKRITLGNLTGWCLLDDGHNGKCAGVLSATEPNTYGPVGWGKR